MLQSLAPKIKQSSTDRIVQGRHRFSRCTPQGQIRYALKTPYRDGTTRVIFDALDFSSPPVLLLRARVNQTRYYGVFARIRPPLNFRAEMAWPRQGEWPERLRNGAGRTGNKSVTKIA